MKKFVVIALALGLAACAATPAEQAYDMETVKTQLPDGCELHYAGNVRVADEHRSSRIFFVTCNNTVTTSVTDEVPQGKSTVTVTDVTVTK